MYVHTYVSGVTYSYVCTWCILPLRRYMHQVSHDDSPPYRPRKGRHQRDACLFSPLLARQSKRQCPWLICDVEPAVASTPRSLSLCLNRVPGIGLSNGTSAMTSAPCRPVHVSSLSNLPSLPFSLACPGPSSQKRSAPGQWPDNALVQRLMEELLSPFAMTRQPLLMLARGRRSDVHPTVAQYRV